jgi:PAS domain S-box-containing protein
MEVNSTKKEFISIFKKLVLGDFAKHKAISEIVVVDSNHRFICSYQADENFVSTSKLPILDWIDQIQFINNVFVYKIPNGIYLDNENHPTMWIYAYPFTNGKDSLYYLLCRHKDKNNLYLMQLLCLLSEAVSSRFALQQAHEETLLYGEYQRQIVETISEGFMSINKKGFITYLNRAGAEILGLKVEEVVGKHMYDVVDFQPKILSVLETGKGWIDREFFIKMPKGQIHLIKSAIPIFNEISEIVGVIDTFREIKTVRKLVADMVGATAVFSFDDIIYSSPSMDKLIKLTKTAAKNDSNILIEGESGTGKELFAQAIHNHSNRAFGPFVVIDCSAIPRELVESELFGYMEGAFTGARKGGRPGKFELANGGTVFLDEIGEMPLDMQAKLLRVIQSRTVTRIGGNEQIPVDIRIVAATNRNLEEEVKKNNFRLDLFYRLNVIHLPVPALRESKEDIPRLVQLFLQKIALKDKRMPPEVTVEARNVMRNYLWPGNVRELENVVERAFLLAEDGLIELDHLPAHIVKHNKSEKINSIENDKEEHNTHNFSTTLPLKKIECESIIQALHNANGNKSLAAKKLGISRSSLYDKLRRFNI